MLRGYKYRIYPSREQEEDFSRHFGHTRHVYNWALEQKTEHFKASGKYLSRRALQDKLVASKKADKPWLKEVNSQALLSSLLHLESAFSNFFEKNKKGEVGKAIAKRKAKGKPTKKIPYYPKFKSKKDNWHSFQCPQHVRVDFENELVWIPKIRWVRVNLHRSFEGKIKTCTLKKSPGGKYYISILVDDGNEFPEPAPIQEETTVGIDLGLHTFVTESGGSKHENPRHLQQSLSRLSVLQRIHSRKKKGSNNKQRMRLRVANQHQKTHQRRIDFLHKTSFLLLRENQVETVAMEDLNVRGMMANKKLARHIADVSWGTFGSFLQYKAKWTGKNVIQCDRFSPSSKQCVCGYKNNELTLADRSWTCQSCGALHDRDILAAQNIKRFALTEIEKSNGTVRADV